MQCLSLKDFEELGSGQMQGVRRLDADSHLSSCLTCRSAFERFRLQSRSGNRSDDTVATSDAVTIATGSVGIPAPSRTPQIEGYTITGVLGQGGMGIVYRAVQTKLNRTVALKVLPAMVGSASPSAVQRFRREATAAARLHHTN